ncbi:MAG: branched-chain amino acid transaminase [candidate division NC10 bacterium]|nr:branched-chain amino acid transaminase [candidate division NC10 bacterium]
MPTVYFRDRFMPQEQAQISVRTNALHYGTAVFEGIRAYWEPGEGQLYVFRLPEHYDRMLRNCRVLHLNVGKDVKELCRLTVELLRLNAHREDTYVRPIAFVSSEEIGPRLHGYTTGFAVFTLPLGDYLDTSQGLKVGFSSWRRISDNAIPARCKVAGGYVNSALARTEAAQQGYDEALFLTEDGLVCEGSAENIFLVRAGRLITPDRSADILEGITRETLLTLAREELGLPVEERPVGRTELYLADEVFLCGTGAQVAPVVEVDRRPIGEGTIGPVTARLQRLYFDAVRGKVPAYRQWLTPVY